jgi:hypothetical protein
MKQTMIYLLLLAIILAGYLLSETKLESGNSLIIGLSAIKFLLIAFFFMDLKQAAVFWKFLMTGLISIFIIIALIS